MSPQRFVLEARKREGQERWYRQRVYTTEQMDMAFKVIEMASQRYSKLEFRLRVTPPDMVVYGDQLNKPAVLHEGEKA